MTVKIVAQMRINRPDLAEGTLHILKSVDEDNCLTVLSQIWIQVSDYFFPPLRVNQLVIIISVAQMYKSGMQSNIDEIINQLN